MAELTGKDFWGRIYAEQYKQKMTDSALSDMSGIPYGTIHTQKARQTLPKADILLALCKALNVSADYLLTGEVKQDFYPRRIERIIDRCLAASGDDLALVERVLRIESDDGEKSSASSGIA